MLNTFFRSFKSVKNDFNEILEILVIDSKFNR